MVFTYIFFSFLRKLYQSLRRKICTTFNIFHGISSLVSGLKIFSTFDRTCYYRTIVLRTWRAYRAYLVQQEARHVSRIARESRMYRFEMSRNLRPPIYILPPHSVRVNRINIRFYIIPFVGFKRWSEITEFEEINSIKLDWSRVSFSNFPIFVTPFYAILNLIEYRYKVEKTVELKNS